MEKKIRNIIKKKGKKPLVCLTAYSFIFSRILDKYCDLILVGDSLANVVYSMKNTHEISLDTMILHAKSVVKGIKKSVCVVDMPKNTYKNKLQAKNNAKKILKETKANAVKIESNGNNYEIIEYLVKNKISVMGHIGFTPQFKKKFSPAGMNKKEENILISDAKNIQRAGAFSIVLECISSQASKRISNILRIPTIGIGSSSNCDGQILVTDDMLGLSGFNPKFVKKFAQLNKVIEKGVQKYKNSVIKKKFPKKNNSFN